MFKIILINMPFTALEYPAIGLTQLKAVVEKQFGEQVSVKILNLNQDTARYLGLQAHHMIIDSMEHHNTGLRDWFFRQAAFPHLKDNIEEYFQRYYPQRNERIEMYKRFIQEKRRGLDGFLRQLVANYSIDQADLVGFTSMFSQNVPSFAMARTLKEIRPEIITVMGGANCESPMGQEIVKNAEFIDFVFSGPALKSFPQFVGHRINQEIDKCHRINGVFSKAACNGRRPEAGLGDFTRVAIIGDELDIDAKIDLDYEPFLNDINRNFPNKEVEPVLLFETSRGCWWGEKAHCTFCGLNGMSMNYRAMSTERALEQFDYLFSYADRAKHFSCVDNIMPRSYLKEVFPRLSPPEHVSIFYEVKADLSEEDIQVLAKAQVKSIQPGVESLATSTLKLMRKGTNAFQNVQLLKHCSRYGISPGWNLLLGFPGEEEEVYKKYVEDLPLLVHLPPPSGAFPVRFDRYSPYFVKAKEYELDLQPVDYYAFTYPFAAESISNLAYYFTDRNITAKYSTNMIRWLGKIKNKVDMWSTRWKGADGKPRPKLYFKSRDAAATIYDSRAGEVREYELDRVGSSVLEHLVKPKRISDLAKELGHIPHFDPDKEVARLQERGLLFQEGERFLSLVLSGEPHL